MTDWIVQVVLISLIGIQGFVIGCMWKDKERFMKSPIEMNAYWYNRFFEIYEDCKRKMDGIYSPTVALFLLKLATSRGRMDQLRDLVSMGYKTDDIRRLIMNKTYISPRALMNLMSRDAAKFIWEIPFSHRGRFGNFWQRAWYGIKRWIQALF